MKTVSFSLDKETEQGINALAKQSKNTSFDYAIHVHGKRLTPPTICGARQLE
jgi:hypothetical protein